MSEEIPKLQDSIPGQSPTPLRLQDKVCPGIPLWEHRIFIPSDKINFKCCKFSWKHRRNPQGPRRSPHRSPPQMLYRQEPRRSPRRSPPQMLQMFIETSPEPKIHPQLSQSTQGCQCHGYPMGIHGFADCPSLSSQNRLPSTDRDIIYPDGSHNPMGIHGYAACPSPLDIQIIQGCTSNGHPWLSSWKVRNPVHDMTSSILKQHKNIENILIIKLSVLFHF